MSWVKVLLYEAFHAKLMKKTYDIFGAVAIALWDKKPGEMSFNELMDYARIQEDSSIPCN